MWTVFWLIVAAVIIVWAIVWAIKLAVEVFWALLAVWIILLIIGLVYRVFRGGRAAI